MPTTRETVKTNPWLDSSKVVPVRAGPNNTLIIDDSNSVPVSTFINDPAYKGKTILIMASQELQANIKNIQDIITLNQQIQKSLLSKIHGSVLNADFELNGATALSFESYTSDLFKKNPGLSTSVVLTDPIPGVLALTPANQFQQYLDATQLLTQAGAPIKGKIAKLDKTVSDGYYYMEYPAFKVIEAFHQAYLANTQNNNQPIDLAFVNELRFSGMTTNIELNMNRTGETLSTVDATNINILKGVQLSGFQKIVISNLNGNVRIVRGAFSGYNFQSLKSIEFSNISGRVLIDDGAFSSTNMPNLQSITFDNITQGLVLKDNVFAGSIMSNLTNIVLAEIPGELTIGNNVFPSYLTSQISNMVFQANTGRISILDSTLKNLIKFGFEQATQGVGYQVYGDDFKWIKNKLALVESLLRAGFRGVALPAATTCSYSAAKASEPVESLSSIVQMPKPLSAEDKSLLRLCQDGQTHDKQIFLGIIFFAVSGFLLYYVLEERFFQK